MSLAIPACASAGAWLPTTKLTELNRVDPQVAMFPSGESVVVWSPKAPSPAEAGPAGIEATMGRPGGAFGPPQAISAPGAAAVTLTSNGNGYAAASWFMATGDPGRSTLQVAARGPGGSFGLPANVREGHGDLAVDGEGNVTALIREGYSPARLAAVTARPDGSLGPEREVARLQLMNEAVVAVDQRGTITVAWSGTLEGTDDRRSRIYVAEAPAGGEFGAPQAISEPFSDNGASGRPLGIASNARGDQLLVWPTEGDREASYVSRATLAASYRAAGGSFGTPEPIPTAEGVPRGVYRWDLALGPDGDAIVAWTEPGALSYAYRPASGPFEPARGASPYLPCCARAGQRDEPQVAFDGRGNAMIVYVISDRDHADLEAIRRPHGGDFGPPERIFGADQLFKPDVALDTAGNAIVVSSPQDRFGHSPGRHDHGVYATYYDADAAPAITRLALARARRPRFVFRSLATARVTIAVDRGQAGRRFRRVLAWRELAVRGANRVQLTRRRTRVMSRPGDYRATITGRDRWGNRLAPRRLRFGPLGSR